MISKNSFMVISMNNLKIRDKLEKIFSKLNLEYEYIPLDGDLNYIIKFSPKSISEITGMVEIFMFYNFEDNILVTICPKIYKFKKGDSTLSILSALNRANQKLTSGSLIYNKKNVSYKGVITYNDENSITIESIKNILNNVIASLVYTYDEIRKMKRYEKQ